MRVAVATVCLLTLAAQPHPAEPLEKGQTAFRAKDWTNAAKWFSEALRRQPSSVVAHKWLGMTYAAEEKYSLAEAPFRKACELDSAAPDVCYYLGRTLYTLSRFDDAIAAYRKAPPAESGKGRTLLGMALALEALNRDAEAEQYYRKAIAAGERQAAIDYEKFRRKQAAAAVPSPEIRFVAADLPVTVRNGATGEKHLIETMIAGVAVLDFDNDGWLDVYIANGAHPADLVKSDPSFHNALLRNNHDGSFTDVSFKAGVTGSGYSMGVAAGDFDNDGWTDLFVTGVRSNHLYRNLGNGTFADVTDAAGVRGDGSWSVAAAWLDFDLDGLLDLFVVRYVAWDPSTETYCGGKNYRQYCHPKLYAPLANALYRNLGNGKFQDVSVESDIGALRGRGMGVAVGDYDDDGLPDIFVSNDTLPNFLFHNRGGGRFEEVALAAGVALNSDGKSVSSMGVEFRDYDNDGREDLFVTALTNESFPLFRNLGDSRFADMTLASGVAKASLPWTGWSNVVADFNNDGWKDLFTANGHVMDNAELSSGRESRQPNLLFTNGRRSFEGRTVGGKSFHRGLAAGDFDRDGRMDLVVTRLNEPAEILWNRTKASKNWIALRLEGRKSNRDAIGAWVEIETQQGKQWNRVAGASGYGCTSSRELHFGLGDAREVQRLTIRWPSGTTQELYGVRGGTVVRLEEPAQR